MAHLCLFSEVLEIADQDGEMRNFLFIILFFGIFLSGCYAPFSLTGQLPYDRTQDIKVNAGMTKEQVVALENLGYPDETLIGKKAKRYDPGATEAWVYSFSKGHRYQKLVVYFREDVVLGKSMWAEH